MEADKWMVTAPGGYAKAGSGSHLGTMGKGIAADGSG